MRDLNEDIEKVLLSKEDLNKICDRLAHELTEDYKDSPHPLIFVIILKGAIMFATDLLRRISLPCGIEFMKVSSYGSGVDSSGFIQVHLDLKRDVKDCDIVFVEDIIDSGRTLAKLGQLFAERGAHSVKCCTLLDKPDRRVVDLDADYVGSSIPDAFVVGYGLDYDEYYRNLPYIGVLKRSVYEK